ncbi:MAG TPA: AraC family transcriptional regulator [Thermoanaerobaculia bacterium]|nr:AraC family transcriptional regulator [Thermoanaerobaculia bacterium]
MSLTVHPIDTPLGRWTHTEWRPDPGSEMAGLVQHIWHFEGTLSFTRERHFPNGTLELIVQLDDPYRDIHGERTEVCPSVCFTGLQTGPMVIEAPGGFSRVLGVRLHPAGAYALFGRSLAETSGISSVDVRDLAGPAADELAERCHAAASAEERLRAAASWVGERLARSRGVDPAIAWTAAQIERRHGAVSIAALRERAGLTKTRLATAFREQIGVPPKLYARIQRFRHLLTLLHAQAGSLADLSAEAGYYDQPHMNAEFRKLSGVTPGDFLAARRYTSSSLAEPAP